MHERLSLRDMIVVFERLSNWREVQAFKTSYFDDIVFKTPLLGLKWYDLVDVLEKARDGVCLGAVRLRDIPENVCSRKAVPLDSESKAHGGRDKSREGARLSAASVVLVNFWI
jgi:hypothetical protein